MKQRLPRKKKKQSRLVSKWLAANPLYRPIEPYTNRLNINVQTETSFKYQTVVVESDDFFQRCPDAMQRIRTMLAEGFTQVVSQYMDVSDVTDEADAKNRRRRFEAVLSLIRTSKA